MRFSQKTGTSGKFIATVDGVLRRNPPGEVDALQMVVTETLRPRLLSLAHDAKLAGHPGQSRMYGRLKKRFYWPQMADDVATTVQRCAPCARKILRLRKRTNPTAVPRPRTSRFGSLGHSEIPPKFSKQSEITPIYKVPLH